MEQQDDSSQKHMEVRMALTLDTKRMSELALREGSLSHGYYIVLEYENKSRENS